MIKLKSITVNDFGPFKGKHTLNIGDKDLLGIVGEYTGKPGSSNGAGKTFLVEALPFGLFGYGRVALDQLTRRGAMGCEVTLDIDVDGSSCIIKRGRGDKEGVTVQPPEGSIIKGARSCNPYIIDMLGTSLDTFLATSFFAQGKADLLVAAPPAKRKEYLYEILGLEIFERAYSVAAKEGKAVEDAKMAHNADLNAKRDLLKDINPPDEREIKNTVGDLARAKKALTDTREVLKKEQVAHDARAKFEQAAAVAEGKIPGAKMAITRQEKEVDRTKREWTYAQRRVTDLQKGLIEPSGIEIELKETQDRVNAQEQIVRDLRAKSTKAAANAERYEADLKTLDDVEGTCPTCKQEVSAEYREVLIGEIKTRLREFRDMAHADTVSLRPAENGLKERRKQLATIQGNLADAQAQDKVLEEAQKSVPSRELEHVNARQALDALRDDLNKIVAASRKASSHLQSTPQPDVGQAQRAVDIALDQTNKATGAEAALSIRVEKGKQLKRGIAEVSTKLATAEKETVLYTTVKEILGKKGVPALLIDAAVVDMEAAANEFLDRLLPGFYLNIVTTQHTQTGKEVETLDFEISDGSVVRAIESFSGGERMLLNFTLRLAIAEAVAVRASKGIDFLVLDEIFGSLDESNRQAVASILKELQDRFPQIILISHADIASLFPRIVKVVKSSEGSSIIENGKRKSVVDSSSRTGNGKVNVPAVGEARKSRAGSGPRVRNGKGGKSTALLPA